MGKKRFLILDANVLIDFLKFDRIIIKLTCSYVGQVYLATMGSRLLHRNGKMEEIFIYLSNICKSGTLPIHKS